jgi:hypothetical protein
MTFDWFPQKKRDGERGVSKQRVRANARLRRGAPGEAGKVRLAPGQVPRCNPDRNGDGLTDIVSSSYWSKPFTWWRHPTRENEEWRETVIASHSPVEFVFSVDILGTGKPLQLLPQFGNPKAALAWYELVGNGTEAKWLDHEVSPQSYGHGIGAGDINGDGRPDIITPKGWFEAPLDRRNEKWSFDPEFELGATGFILLWI